MVHTGRTGLAPHRSTRSWADSTTSAPASPAAWVSNSSGRSPSGPTARASFTPSFVARSAPIQSFPPVGTCISQCHNWSSA